MSYYRFGVAASAAMTALLVTGCGAGDGSDGDPAASDEAAGTSQEELSSTFGEDFCYTPGNNDGPVYGSFKVCITNPAGRTECHEDGIWKWDRICSPYLYGTAGTWHKHVYEKGVGWDVGWTTVQAHRYYCADSKTGPYCDPLY